MLLFVRNVVEEQTRYVMINVLGVRIKQRKQKDLNVIVGKQQGEINE